MFLFNQLQSHPPMKHHQPPPCHRNHSTFKTWGWIWACSKTTRWEGSIGSGEVMIQWHWIWKIWWNISWFSMTEIPIILHHFASTRTSDLGTRYLGGWVECVVMSTWAPGIPGWWCFHSETSKWLGLRSRQILCDVAKTSEYGALIAHEFGEGTHFESCKSFATFNYAGLRVFSCSCFIHQCSWISSSKTRSRFLGYSIVLSTRYHNPLTYPIQKYSKIKGYWPPVSSISWTGWEAGKRLWGVQVRFRVDAFVAACFLSKIAGIPLFFYYWKKGGFPFANSNCDSDIYIYT